MCASICERRCILPKGPLIGQFFVLGAELNLDRIYRQPWARHAALEEIRRETGPGMFDPSVVAVLSGIMGGQ
jgi:response regulator RpfG family c-di-GMP phosphodiesterase